MKNSSFPRIFSAGHIGSLHPKNRLVLPPIVRNYADENGCATPRYIAHIERIARGGVGTIILEASYVRQDGKGFARQLGIHDDIVIPGLRKLVEAGRQYGALMGIQLFHGGRQASAKTSGTQPVAPSAIPDPLVNEMPHELTTEEITAVVAAFGAAAERAKRIGFDFVELHGAHGYLIAQFLSPFSNARKDEYGGSPQNRDRFLEEIYSAVRQEVGESFPVTVRLSAEELIPKGLTIDDTVATAKHLERLGVAALHISSGNYATYAQGTMIPPMAMADGVLIPLAAKVKQAVSIPVIAVGKLRTPEMVENILEKGHADFIALGRSLLADPDWPKKVAAGLCTKLRHCISCNQGCISRLFAQQSVWCTINPEAGREQAFAKLRGGVGRPLLIIGGGAAGMAAARWGAKAGFRVTLHEARSMLGGQLIAAAAAPHREGWGALRNYLISELDRLKVDIRLFSKLDVASVLREKPLAVILATGAEPMRPSMPGWEEMHVVTGRDVLEKTAMHRGPIVIAGGGCSGAQTAEYLAQNGHDVTVLEAEGDIAIDAPTDERALLLARLQQLGVKLMSNTRLIGMALGNVVVLSPHETRMLPADTVVFCLGSQSVTDLLAPLTESGVPVRVIGDAVKPRKVTEAIAEGAMTILDLLGAPIDSALREELHWPPPADTKIADAKIKVPTTV